MPFNIVADWNGTILVYPTDEIQNKKIAYAILDDTRHSIKKGKIWKIGDIVKLVRARKQLERRLQEYKEGKRHPWEVYEPFNRMVLEGEPVSLINSVIDEYAKESAKKVDGRILRPLRAVRRDCNTGILSVSYDYSIKRILEESSFDDVFDPKDIVANTLSTHNDRAIGLTLKIYGAKPEVLQKEFFEKRGFRENNTIYLGNSEDDEPIAEILSSGRFIVPFYADDEFKEKCAKKYKAFVPENEGEFLRYLKL